ncbi:MAG: hypothetical protein A2219_08820 [Elusimicrobia bacterium RIFOXYA2_FULL_50_26]|nr:MAG: hypothetical protein A2219_08820 [Elusimicrobia bacterium RIFOXYA2_FULL_50_26]
MHAMKLEKSSVFSSVSDAQHSGAQENVLISPSRQNQQEDWFISYGLNEYSTDMLLSSEIISSAKTADVKVSAKIKTKNKKSRPGVVIVTLAFTSWLYDVFKRQITD